ncbi:MAG: UDP-3-O-(3-hydroxymyristoyl)glucosamine N-acyltransferase [Shimia sp.]
MATYTLARIADALGLPVLGDGGIEIDGTAEPAAAGPRELALASTPAYAEGLPEGRARAALVWEGADWRGMGLEGAIAVARPRYAMAGLSALMDDAFSTDPGIHPSAIVDASARLGTDVALGPFCVIGPGVRIGDGTQLGAHVTVGRGSVIGQGGRIRDGVRIAHGVTIGARAVIHQNAAIGVDGFSFVTPEPSTAETARASLGTEQGKTQAWARIHSLGGVEIGDDVEIGANGCIDRGTVRATRIGDGCKIDNMVQIAHNVVLGPDCLMAGQSGLAGSVVLGRGVVMGGQSGVADNVTVGDGVVIGGASVVLSNVPAGRMMLGYPATRMDDQVASYKALRRLPRDIAALKKAVSKGDATT